MSTCPSITLDNPFCRLEVLGEVTLKALYLLGNKAVAGGVLLSAEAKPEGYKAGAGTD